MMEPGYTLFRALNNNSRRAYIVVVNNVGEIVWYSSIPTTSVVRPLENGNLFIPLTRSFVEVVMYQPVPPPRAIVYVAPRYEHHDDYRDRRGYDHARNQHASGREERVQPRGGRR